MPFSWWPFPWPKPHPRPHPPPAPPAPAPGPVSAADVYPLLNAARYARGLQKLTFDPRLEACAARRIARMVAAGRIDHFQYAEDIRAAMPGCSNEGEVLAEGQTSAAQAVRTWLDHPPHRAELMGDFTLMGAGVTEGAGGMLYWIVDFAKV